MNIEKLLNSLTLEEKIGQMTQLIPDYITGSCTSGLTGPLNEINISDHELSKIGSILCSMGAEQNIELQNRYIKNSRHKIPLLIMNDIIHGYETIFPIPLGIGASFDIDLAEGIARISAIESSSAGTHVTFSPMVDLCCDPRFGRVMESTGEDPYLNSQMSRAFVRGYQGKREEKFKREFNIAACVKHFAGYGRVSAGRDYNFTDIPEYTLRQNYLPSYKAAVDEGVEMVMTSFNTVNGLPPSINNYLMNDILRTDWKYKGVVITDWNALGELYSHGLKETPEGVAKAAINCNVDIEMMSCNYFLGYKKLIEGKELTEDVINNCVHRILELKNKLGLFENPHRYTSVKNEEKYLKCKEHLDYAMKSVEDTCVLLKNENTLPLINTDKVVLIGNYAKSNEILGAWSCNKTSKGIGTLEEGFEAIGHKIDASKVIDVYSDVFNTNEVDRLIENKEVVVIAVGEHQDDIGEGTSKAYIKISKGQIDLIKYVKSKGKKVVVVIFNGRPLDLSDIIAVDAIVVAWFPGTMGGVGIAKLLTGKVNFSGKLPITFPKTVGQCPIFYNAYKTGRPKQNPSRRNGFCSEYIDESNEPLFCFGEGYSYSNFKYLNLKIYDKIMQEKIIVSIDVFNNSDFDGREVVQLYLGDRVSRVIRPVHELIGFKKVFIKAGSTVSIKFEITKDMLKYYDNMGFWGVESGGFDIHVGTSSKDFISGYFELA